VVLLSHQQQVETNKRDMRIIKIRKKGPEWDEYLRIKWVLVISGGSSMNYALSDRGKGK